MSRCVEIDRVNEALRENVRDWLYRPARIAFGRWLARFPTLKQHLKRIEAKLEKWLAPHIGAAKGHDQRTRAQVRSPRVERIAQDLRRACARNRSAKQNDSS